MVGAGKGMLSWVGFYSRGHSEMCQTRVRWWHHSGDMVCQEHLPTGQAVHFKPKPAEIRCY